jgi:hypothetical protein
MAKTFDERRREREKEELKSQEDTSLSAKRGIPSQRKPEVPTAIHADQFLVHLEKAETLIDQVNGLYNQYLSGIETKPPIERRKVLEQLMGQLQSMPKPTSTQQFRFNSLNASYLTHRDRWDRMLRDIESGKIVRKLRGKAA